MKCNNFQDDLEYSSNPVNIQFLDNCYKQYFGDIDTNRADEGIQRIPYDRSNIDILDGKGCFLQHSGIDVFIYLKNGMVFTIEEKVRARWYSDLLLEYKSVAYNNHESLGWIYKSVSNYLLSYSCPEKNILYLYPFVDLKHKWNTEGTDLINSQEAKQAYNSGGWTTYNIAVPLDFVKPVFFIDEERRLREERKLKEENHLLDLQKLYRSLSGRR